MTRRLASLLLPLVTAAPLYAAPVTSFAFGHVTEDLSAGTVAPRTFASGEAVTIRYTYDLDPTPTLGGRPLVTFELLTGGGFEHRPTFASSSSVLGSGSDIRVRAAADPWSLDLRLVDGVGTLRWEVDLPSGVMGFRAGVARTDTFLPPLSHAPEPSAFLMGMTAFGIWLGATALKRIRLSAVQAAP